uniref:Imine reductase n=1 Tax=Huperzia serrata TaxID=355589 RepID=A0A2R4H1S0_HUPSR|nr:imine reductase [Huperzia serrata]
MSMAMAMAEDEKHEGGWRSISASTMRALLSYPSLVHVLQSAFAHPQRFCVPHRQHYPLSAQPPPHAPATLLIMPAWSHASSSSSRASALIGVKIATVFPANSDRGLPAVSASYLLLSAHTGLPLCVFDGNELTLWRTACASALAARFLAKTDARSLVMVGAGAMAPHLIKAHISVRPSLKTVVIWNRNPKKATDLADLLAKDSAMEGVQFNGSSSTNLEVAVRDADIVSCATLSEAPLVEGKWLKRGVHLDLVGSFTPAMRECDDDAIRRCGVFVDSSLALREAGELAGAIQRGVISPQDVVADLSELARGEKLGRQTEEEMTLFKSVGCALEDLATAEYIYTNLYG